MVRFQKSTGITFSWLLMDIRFYQVRNHKNCFAWLPCLSRTILGRSWWKRIETLMCWTLWLIQRDLHPALLFNSSCFSSSALLWRSFTVLFRSTFNSVCWTWHTQQIIDRKKAQREKLEMLIAQGHENTQEAIGLAKAIKRIHPNEYVYGNCFDDFELYLNQDFLDPKTLLLGSIYWSRDWFDCDYGTYDRVAKAKNYQRKP